MVREYATGFYAPAHALGERLLASDGAGAAALASWLDSVRQGWDRVRVLDVAAGGLVEQDVGAEVPVRVRVALNGLSPDDVAVQVYLARVTSEGTLTGGRVVEAVLDGPEPDGSYRFQAPVRFERSGRLGLAVRVVPRHADLASSLEAGLVRWSAAPETQ